MKYRIFFEIYGKKMQTVIEAKSENEAKEKVKNKIIFDKIESAITEQEANEAVNYLKNMFGFKE
jgi:hypothetical protein